jgi:hypothetical protein
MRQVELVLQAVLDDVCEQRLALEEAVEKICADPFLREALFLDLRNMALRVQEQQEFMLKRKKAGLKIDPATAEVIRQYVPIDDPYGIYDSPHECIGAVLFARAPDGDVWVSQYELPRDCGCPRDEEGGPSVVHGRLGLASPTRGSW